MALPTIRPGDRRYRRLLAEVSEAEPGVLLVSGPEPAARVAGALGLDLYRIDLSTVVSKYIGETEKNLRRELAAPEARGAALLFDQADAVFGRREDPVEQDFAAPGVGWLLEQVAGIGAVALFATARPRRLPKELRRRAAAYVEAG